MPELKIQSARTVAYRTLCLGALLRRSGLELGMQHLSEVPEDLRSGWQREHQAIHHKLGEWLIEEKIAPYISPNERALFDASLGSWTSAIIVKTSWRAESLGMLLWAMGIVDVPYYDTQFTPDGMLEPLDLLNPTIDYIWQASVRDASVIHQALELADVWIQRAHIMDSQGAEQLPADDTSYEEMIRKLAEKAYADGNIPEMIKGDLPVLGKAYAELSPEEYNTISSIAYERFFALNWICCHRETWDGKSDKTD